MSIERCLLAGPAHLTAPKALDAMAAEVAWLATRGVVGLTGPVPDHGPRTRRWMWRDGGGYLTLVVEQRAYGTGLVVVTDDVRLARTVALRLRQRLPCVPLEEAVGHTAQARQRPGSLVCMAMAASEPSSLVIPVVLRFLAGRNPAMRSEALDAAEILSWPAFVESLEAIAASRGPLWKRAVDVRGACRTAHRPRPVRLERWVLDSHLSASALAIEVAAQLRDAADEGQVSEPLVRHDARAFRWAWKVRGATVLLVHDVSVGLRHLTVRSSRPAQREALAHFLRDRFRGPSLDELLHAARTPGVVNVAQLAAGAPQHPDLRVVSTLHRALQSSDPWVSVEAGKAVRALRWAVMAASERVQEPQGLQVRQVRGARHAA